MRGLRKGRPPLYIVDETRSTPITSTDQLVRYFAEAGKPAARWRVGSEHELVGVVSSGPNQGQAPSYEQAGGISALLAWHAARGWTPVQEGDHTIGLTRGDEQISLEPGGQFELAGRAVDDDRTFSADLAAYSASLREASRELGITWLSTGLRPFGDRANVPVMPKQRYDIMRAYMPTVGTRGLDMMLRTATVQSNLDYSDEADASSKMRCLMNVTSILTALWANSPIVEERVSGYQSYRAYIWRDTDNQRSGLLPFVWQGDELFRPYMEWALDVPMYFIYRGGYHATHHLTFRRYMAEGWNDQHATIADWELHLSTLFPETRLKKYLEVRGCDCGSMPMNAALGPFTRGLLYDREARMAGIALTASLSYADRQALADAVPTQGMLAMAGKYRVGDLARELVAIVQDGLRRVAPGALSLIDPVAQIAASGRTQADEMITRWNAANGDRAAQIRALAHPELV